MTFKKTLVLPILLTVAFLGLIAVVQKYSSETKPLSSSTALSVVNDATYTDEKNKFSFKYPSNLFKPRSEAKNNSSWIYQPSSEKYIILSVDILEGDDYTQRKSVYSYNKENKVAGFEILSETDNGSYTTSIVHTMTDPNRAIDGNSAYVAFIWPKNEEKLILIPFYSSLGFDSFITENKNLFDSIVTSLKFY